MDAWPARLTMVQEELLSPAIPGTVYGIHGRVPAKIELGDQLLGLGGRFISFAVLDIFFHVINSKGRTKNLCGTFRSDLPPESSS